MVEAGANEASEAEVVEAIEFGHDCCKKIVAGIRELVKLAGKPKTAITFLRPRIRKSLDKISDAVRADLSDALNTQKYGSSRATAASIRRKRRRSRCSRKKRARPKPARYSIDLKERIFRDEMLKDRRRPDGRAFDQIRPIYVRSRRAAAHARFGDLHAR